MIGMPTMPSLERVKEINVILAKTCREFVGSHDLSASAQKLRQLRTLLPDRDSPHDAPVSIYSFGEEVATELEANASLPVTGSFIALFSMLKSYVEVVGKILAPMTEDVPGSERVETALEFMYGMAALGYVDSYIAEIMGLVLDEETHRDYCALVAKLAANGNGPELNSVEKLRAHYSRIFKIRDVIRECCSGDGDVRPDEDTGKLGNRGVFQTAGEGLLLRVWKRIDGTDISLWTPLGSLTAHQCRLSAGSLKRLKARLGLVPTKPTQPIPMWDSSDSLYVVGRDADGVALPAGRQCTPNEALPDFLAETVWTHIRPG